MNITKAVKNIIKPYRSLNKDLVIVKNYENYSDYVNHQQEKTTDPIRREKWLGEEWNTKLEFFESTFKTIVENIPDFKVGKAIGLGARTGQEVQAMINVGFDAVGLDLVPCDPLVIEGDIHEIPFEDSTFDFAFTNIFDHSLYPQRFLKEIKRILKPGGFALMHLAIGTTDEYGVTELKSASPVKQIFKKSNIVLDEKIPEWGGLNYQLLVQIAK